MKKGQMKTVLLIVGIFLFSTIKADEGEQLFKKTCTACHTIGKGRLVGPDLLNINEKQSQDWLIAFIQSSTQLIESGDKDAQAIYEEYNRILMPDNPYTDAQVIAILNYIRQQSKAAAGGEQSAPVEDILSGTTSENINTGMNLFTGKQKFKNGGSTCISCHNVQDERIFSSGTLALDLSQSYANMGSAGVSAIIANPPFPVMNMAFKNHPLTSEEVVNLTAYLKSVSDKRVHQASADFSLYFVLAGLFVFISMMLVILVLYFDRKRLAVNHEIFSRQTKVVN